MKVAQKLYKNGEFTKEAGDQLTRKGNLLVLGFGGKNLLVEEDIYTKLKGSYPTGDIVLCSTSGEIYDDVVSDNTVSVVAMEFEKTKIKTISININDVPNSFEAGKNLFNQLNEKDLAYVLIISDGGLVNGSELVRGIENVNVNKIPV
ncbi:MAG TPA: FIST N-terminal domain-containing protein, partial [Mucilaginibacter sp.]|nr:FIST N-terminal domain-containing protein [Mucilaginibacter sp.]